MLFSTAMSITATLLPPNSCSVIGSSQLIHRSRYVLSWSVRICRTVVLALYIGGGRCGPLTPICDIKLLGREGLIVKQASCHIVSPRTTIISRRNHHILGPESRLALGAVAVTVALLETLFRHFRLVLRRRWVVCAIEKCVVC